MSKRFIFIPFLTKDSNWCLVLIENIAYNISDYAIGKKPDIILGYDNYDPQERSGFKLYLFEKDTELSSYIQNYIPEMLEKYHYIN